MSAMTFMALLVSSTSLWRNRTVPTREAKRWQDRQKNKTMRQVRKQIKRNRKAKRTRRRDWTPDNLDDLEALDEFYFPQSERIMPRGERERRRTLLAVPPFARWIGMPPSPATTTRASG